MPDWVEGAGFDTIGGMYDLKSPHVAAADDILETLGVDREAGLSSQEAAKRLAQYGPNALQRTEPVRLWAIFARQFRSAVVALLAVAAVLSLIFGDLPESIAVIAVILINAIIGFGTELSAVRSMEALHRLTTVRYRAPYSDRWEERPLAWAMERIAQLVKETRDASFQETDEDGVPVMRTHAIGHFGGATLDNEENYLIKKLLAGGLGIIGVENQARI